MMLMRKTTLVLILPLLAGATLLAGCASSQSGSSYTPNQAQREMTVRMGIVESVRQVTISGTKSGAGQMAGTVVGGIAGSNIGGGNRGSAVGAILGAVGGAIAGHAIRLRFAGAALSEPMQPITFWIDRTAGHAIEEASTKKNGLEITVRYDSGSIGAITQEADEQFNPGDRVRVLSGSGATRVSH